MIPGSNPAVCVNNSTGEEFCATWTEPGWDCYRRLPGEEDFELAAHVADGPEKQAGLAFLPSMDGALVFAYNDGSQTKYRYSRDQGDTWTDS